MRGQTGLREAKEYRFRQFQLLLSGVPGMNINPAVPAAHVQVIGLGSRRGVATEKKELPQSGLTNEEVGNPTINSI